MLLCFVDESHEGDIYAFGAVLADEHATKDLTASLTRIIDQASVDYGIARSAEIHSYPLWHGRDDWDGVPTRARASVFRQTVQAIAASDVTVLMRGVSLSRLARRQQSENYPVDFPPEQVCFQHILQRANAVAQIRNDYALIIADERDDRERHRDYFATYQAEGTPGIYMNTNLGRLLDTVHFAPSHRSRMLQAADTVAFLYRRWNSVTESDARTQTLMSNLQQTLMGSGKVYQNGIWP